MTSGTRVVWGEPLGCAYLWVEPGLLAEHAHRLLRVGRRVGAAQESLAAAARVPELEFSGAAAEGFRSRALRHADQAAEGRANLHGVADALDQHAELLLRYRDDLAHLRRLALEHELEVRDQRIWAPTLAFSSPEGHRYAAWLKAWRAYRACFDLKADIERRRRQESRSLVRAIVEFTGARPDLPDDDGDEQDGPSRPTPDRYAVAALAVLDARTMLDKTTEALGRLRQAHAEALAVLNRLALANAPEDEMRRQAAQVRDAAESLRAARVETATAETALQRALDQVRAARTS